MTTVPPDSADAAQPAPGTQVAATPAQLKRWRAYLSDEQAEAAVYRDLASRRDGEEREILLSLAEAEGRHEQHWRDLLGDQVGKPVSPALNTRLVGWLARRFGGVFVLALAQRAEARAKYAAESDATETMVADEQIHEEVVRALATRGRNRLAGTFRAAVFGANDGLVSNLALVLGIGASGASQHVVLLTGLAGLLAGALSMGAGEFISIRSQRELLAASTPDPAAAQAIPALDVNANELALVYRARGMTSEDAESRAASVMARLVTQAPNVVAPTQADLHADATAEAASGVVSDEEIDTHGTAWGAGISSFLFFATGAIIPVIPYLFGMYGTPAVILSASLVGVALLITGAITGLLSGTSPVTRALRQLAIGWGAAAVTYGLGLAFGTG